MIHNLATNDKFNPEIIHDSSIKRTSIRLGKFKKPPEEYKISLDLRNELTELFRTFEADLTVGAGEGRISAKYVKVILKAMNMEPGPQEFKELMIKINPENPDEYKPSGGSSDNDNLEASKKRSTKSKAPKKRTRSISKRKHDNSKKSFISLPDVGKLVQAKMKDKSSKTQLERAFQLIDHDKKGYISIRDLRRTIKDLGEEISEDELREMIEEADSSNNGRVSLDDFLKFLLVAQENGH